MGSNLWDTIKNVFVQLQFCDSIVRYFFQFGIPSVVDSDATLYPILVFPVPVAFFDHTWHTVSRNFEQQKKQLYPFFGNY